jgi:single-strand DNA-binding protein
MARSLNRVQLIGNLTRDPELRYTPNGTAVCSFGLATNRSWKTDAGEKHDEAEFHNIVAWNKLAELCSQFLVKGRKVYVEGRLATRSWTGQDGAQRNRTEIVISDMILLDSNRGTAGVAAEAPEPVEETKEVAEAPEAGETKAKKGKKKEEVAEAPTEEVVPDDIPF